MPVQCQYFAHYLPIECQSHVNTMPIFGQSTVHPSPIHCQLSPNAVQIHCQSMSIQIHIVANPVSICCRFRSSHLQCGTNPANPPIWLSHAYSWPIRQSGTNLPIHSIFPNPLPIRWQSRPNRRTNPLSILCQSRSTHLQSSANLLAIWINPFPIRQSINSIQWQSGPTQFQSSVNLGQSSANPPPIRHQSGGHLGQSIANPVPFQCQSNTNPVSILDNPLIKCQFWTYLPNSDPLPIRQFNANSIPILYQVAYPSPIHKSNTNPPIHYQSANPSPTKFQSLVNLIPILDQIANP